MRPILSSITFSQDIANNNAPPPINRVDVPESSHAAESSSSIDIDMHTNVENVDIDLDISFDNAHGTNTVEAKTRARKLEEANELEPSAKKSRSASLHAPKTFEYLERLCINPPPPESIAIDEANAVDQQQHSDAFVQSFLKTEDTPEQIALLKQRVIQEKKIGLATSLKNSWETMELIAPHLIAPSSLLSIKVAQEYLKILEKTDPPLDKTNIDAFITQQFDQWLSTQEANSDHEAHLLNALEPDQKDFMKILRAGTWQEQASYQSLLILLQKGFSFIDAKKSCIQKSIKKDATTSLLLI